jgi:hypothetical protein
VIDTVKITKMVSDGLAGEYSERVYTVKGTVKNLMLGSIDINH